MEMETLIWVIVTILIGVAVTLSAPYHHGIIKENEPRVRC
jgi:hypothetical protein